MWIPLPRGYLEAEAVQSEGIKVMVSVRRGRVLIASNINKTIGDSSRGERTATLEGSTTPSGKRGVAAGAASTLKGVGAPDESVSKDCGR